MKFNATDRRVLGASVSMLAMLLATATPVTAQDLPTAAQNAENKSAEPTTQVQSATDDAGQATDGEEIVVTGSLLRQTDAATPSPVTTITAANLDARGRQQMKIPDRIKADRMTPLPPRKPKPWNTESPRAAHLVEVDVRLNDLIRQVDVLAADASNGMQLRDYREIVDYLFFVRQKVQLLEAIIRGAA